VGVGVGVNVAVGVGDRVGVGVGVGTAAQTFSVSALATVVEASYPPAAIIRLLPMAAPDGNDRKLFMFGELAQASLAGL
jgi:hypothetical protein